MKSLGVIVALAAIALPRAALADYRYAPGEGEYAMTLPDAPTAETIWADTKNVPYLKNPPISGPAGEYAMLKRIDPSTNEAFEVRVTFVKADEEFLSSLTQETIKKTLISLFPGVNIDTPKFSFSQGNGPLKWGTYSGFSADQKGDVLYNVAHYLVGAESLMTVKVSYSAQNPAFAAYYKTFSTSIAYLGR